jgi:[acyl-carrier-protein] S-malonyltransferase
MNQPATNELVLLCPGQGAQHVGMGKAWAEKHPAALATFEEASKVLGFDLLKLCTQGPEETIARTDNAQIAIYTTSIACYRALHAAGKLGAPTATAGLSLGEFTALHLAGAFDFATGLKLVSLRGQAMQEAATAVASGMVALIGADEAQANQVCNQTLEGLSGAGEVLVCANFNCPGQIVISGSKAACEKSLTVASALGVKATALKVAGAFHSPIMKPAAERLGKALDQVQWNRPSCPVLSNVTGLAHDEANPVSIKEKLIQQLTSPVRWEECVRWLIAKKPGARFVELSPNKSLSGMMRRIDKGVKVENFAEPE